MNTLDTHIRDVIRAYPGQMPYRADVLVHMFLSMGTGYEWQNGVLKSSSSLTPWSIQDDVRYRQTWGLPVLPPDHPRLLRYAEISATADARCMDPHPPEGIPKINNWSPILYTPSDAKEDWLQGSLEVLRLIESDSSYFQDNEEMITLTKKHLSQKFPGRLSF